MIRYFCLFLFISLSSFAGYNEVLDLITKQDRVLRVTSDTFSRLLKEMNGLDENELNQLLEQKLPKDQTKNLLALMSRLDSKRTVFNLLFKEITNAGEHQKLYSYFTYIVYNPDYLKDIEDTLISAQDINPFLTFLGSQSSENAFRIILKHHNSKNDLSKELLNTVTEHNIKEVLSLLQSKTAPAPLLAEKILATDPGTYDIDTLAFMLNSKQKAKKIEFSEEQISELKDLYGSLNEKNFNTIARRILSDEVSPALNHKVRSFIDLTNELVKKVFQAKALNYNFNTYKKYNSYIDPLNSSNIKTRLQTLLKLRDFSDSTLAPTYIHLLSDSSPDIRRDALDCLSNIMEKNKAALSKFLPVKNENDLQALYNKSKGQKVEDIDYEETVSLTLNKIILLLQDPNPPVVISAIELLTFVNAGIANKQIVNLLSSDNSQILISAIASVEKNEAKGALLKLISLLHHEDWKVRARAAKAIDEFDNKGEFLPRLESMFFKENDPFVKGHIFNFLKESTNPKIFEFLKEGAKNAKNHEEKYDNLIKLLNLEKLPADEVELLRPEFHKFSHNAFCKTWLSVAGEKRLNIEKELILALQRGSSDNKRSALMVAGKRGIDASPYLSKKSYYEIGSDYIFYYINSNKLLETKPKMEMLGFIFSDLNFPEYNEALVTLKNRMSDGLNFNDNERKLVKAILKEAQKKAPSITQTVISIVLKEKLPVSTVDSLMKAYTETEDKSEVIPAIELLAETVNKEQVERYQKQFTELLMNSDLRPYNFSGGLKHFSLENLKKLFNSSTSDQDDYLEALAPKLPFKETLKLCNGLLGSRYVSRSEIYDALKLSIHSMNNDDILPFIDLLEKSNDNNYWELSELLEKVPFTVRSKVKEFVAEDKLDPSTMVFAIVATAFNEKDFKVFYKLTSSIKINSRVFSYGRQNLNLDIFHKASKEKIEKSRIDFEILQFYENIYSFSSSGRGFSSAIDVAIFEKKISEIDEKFRGRVFQILEYAGRNTEAFYELYLSLLQNNVDPFIFKVKISSQRHGYGGGFQRVQAQNSTGSSALKTLKKIFTRKNKKEELKAKIVSRLLELKDSLNGSKLQAVAFRASVLMNTEEYIKSFHKLFKENISLADFIPVDTISKETFSLLRNSMSLKSIQKYKANSIGQNLEPAFVKELISEYRQNLSPELWPFIIYNLSPTETDLILKSLKKSFAELRKSIFNSGNDNIRNEFSTLTQKLRDSRFSASIGKELSVTHEEIQTVYILSLLHVKLPQETLNGLLKLENLNNEQKLQLINSFYINGTYTAEVFKVHENYLSSLSGKALAEAIKLSPKYHDANTEDRNTFSSEDNLTIRQVLSYSGVSYRYYDDEPKPLLIPDNAKEAYASLNDKKLELYKKANDPSLFQYVLDKNNLTLKMVNQYLANGAEELDGPLLENINEQFKNASIEEIKTFLNHILQKEMHLNIPEPNNMGTGFKPEKLAFLKKYFSETENGTIKNLLQPIYFNSLKTDAEFDALVKKIIDDKEGRFINSIGSVSPISKQLKAAFFRYLKNYNSSEKISSEVLPYILSSLDLELSEIKTLDGYLPKFSSELHSELLSLILKEGPYFPNSLNALLKTLESPNQRSIYLDISYLFYKKELDKKKLEPVKEILDKIKAKKLEIYQDSKYTAMKSLLLIIDQDEKFLKSELDKALQNQTVKIYEIYVINKFSEKDQEKYARLFWDKFKNSD
ncbi:MAG: hypothetical protein NE327_22555, partial [Lentisphaeraceae bacterium]|nr:hypothetical protein [Lentisphaeraceae bacterium]